MSEGQRPAAGGPPDPPAGPRSSAGLGTASSATPSFQRQDGWPPRSAPSPTPPLLPARPDRPPTASDATAPFRPRTSRLAALLTAAVVLVVLGVVATGTAIARHADTHGAASPHSTRPLGRRASATAVPGSIEFSTRRGTGRLVLLEHRWEPTAGPDSHLRLRLELVCTGGDVDYAPEYFSLFDHQGHLVEPSRAGAGSGPMAFGRLGPGERVRGSVAFDVPRGEVTLVMGDDVSSVTALRITG